MRSKECGTVLPNVDDMNQQSYQSSLDEKYATAQRMLDMLDDEWIFKLGSAMMRNGLIEFREFVPASGDSVSTRYEQSRPERLDMSDLDIISSPSVQGRDHFVPTSVVSSSMNKEVTERPSLLHKMPTQIPAPHVRDFSQASISVKGETQAMFPVASCDFGKSLAKPQTHIAVQEANEYTTVVVHNLPKGTVQAKAMAWLDCAGFQDAYDFLLLFPAKQSTPNGRGYLFINFLTTAHAKYFRMQFTGYTFPDDEFQCEKHGLRIQVANVQGFAANYKRYIHLLCPMAKTSCVPFFAKRSVEKLTAVEQDLVEPKYTSTPVTTVRTKGVPSCVGLRNTSTLATTIMIRGLPSSVGSQDLAMVWLDEAGYRDEYDFCFLAPKLKTPGAETWQEPHMIVNFENHEMAERCIKTMSSDAVKHGSPKLEIVYSRIQGLSSCMNHFRACFDGTKSKFKPWVKMCYTVL